MKKEKTGERRKKTTLFRPVFSRIFKNLELCDREMSFYFNFQILFLREPGDFTNLSYTHP